MAPNVPAPPKQGPHLQACSSDSDGSRSSPHLQDPVLVASMAHCKLVSREGSPDSAFSALTPAPRAASQPSQSHMSTDTTSTQKLLCNEDLLQDEADSADAQMQKSRSTITAEGAAAASCPVNPGRNTLPYATAGTPSCSAAVPAATPHPSQQLQTSGWVASFVAAAATTAVPVAEVKNVPSCWTMDPFVRPLPASTLAGVPSVQNACVSIPQTNSEAAASNSAKQPQSNSPQQHPSPQDKANSPTQPTSSQEHERESNSSGSSTSTSSGSSSESEPDHHRGFALKTTDEEDFHSIHEPVAPRPEDNKVGVLYDPVMELHWNIPNPDPHSTADDHPERPRRIQQLRSELRAEQLLPRCWRLAARPATTAELLRAHSQEHVDFVDHTYDQKHSEQPSQLSHLAGLDIYFSSGTAHAARTAAGCVTEAVQQVLRGSVQSCMAVVRPPGHHAECSRAMGFCFYNNVVVAARAALQEPGVKRVAIVDWDVHHGNGIQKILYSDPALLYVSLHRATMDDKREKAMFYPHEGGFEDEVGEGDAKGFNVNIPWAKKGATDADYLAAFELVIEPILDAFQPDAIIVAAGFDAAEGDPLGGCKLTPAGYGHMTKRLLRCSKGKLVVALEGGYNTRVTATCAAACVRVLLGEEPEPLEDCSVMPRGEAGKTLRKVSAAHVPYWPALSSQPFDERWEAHLLSIKLATRRLRERSVSNSSS